MVEIPRPDVNTFVIRSGGTVFRATFGDGAPLVVDGYGGWTVTNRPRDIGITEWIGRNPIALEIPFLIDKWMSNDEDRGLQVEQMAKRLERFCGLGSHDHPPSVIIDGHGVIPHDNTNAPGAHRWVIENIEWDRTIELRSGNTQRRLRCGGTIAARQFVKSDPLKRVGRGGRGGAKKKKGLIGKEVGSSEGLAGGIRSQAPFIYIVKKGETLVKISSKIYGTPKRWRRIGDANNIRDPNKKLKVGRHLRIPA